MSKEQPIFNTTRQSKYQSNLVCERRLRNSANYRFIRFYQFKQNPKWIVGFSDVTVLHNHLNTLGFKSIHGIMPITAPKATTEAIESLRIAMFGEK